MKSRLTLLLTVFSISIFYGQDVSKKIKVGFSALPQFSITQFNRDHLVENETSFSYASGFDLYLPLSPKVQFITGVELFGVHLKHRDYSPLFPSDMQNGEADFFKSYYDFASSYRFLGVPLELKWNMGEKENLFYLMGGIKPRLRVSRSGTIWLIESGGSPQPINAKEFFPDVEKLQLSLSFHLGYEWVSRKQTHYSIGPLFEYAVTQVFDDSFMTMANGHFTTVGLRFSFFR